MEANKSQIIDYLNQKLETLKRDSLVIFEHKNIIYRISSSDDGYSYDSYDISNFVGHEILEPLDSGFCIGAKEVIEIAIGEQLLLSE